MREDSTAVLPRLSAAGYTVVARSWGASLHVSDEVLTHLAGLAGAVGPDVHLRRLAPQDAGAAHALFTAHRQDFPTTPATTPQAYTLQEVRELVTADRAYGAWRGGELLALTVVGTDGRAVADTEFTVTDRSARRQGLATAVKAHAVRDVAATTPVRHFRTGGAQANEASLRANRRLGHQLEPLWLSLAGPDQHALGPPPRAEHSPEGPCVPRAPC